jgi:hypothetical protein
VNRHFETPHASAAEARRGFTRSSPTIAPPAPRRWRSSNVTSTPSSPTCAGPLSTASGSERPTCSSAPSSRSAAPHQGHWPLPRREQRAVADLGRARTLKPRLARRRHDPQDRRRGRASPPPAGQHPHRRHRGVHCLLRPSPVPPCRRTVRRPTSMSTAVAGTTPFRPTGSHTKRRDMAPATDPAEASDWLDADWRYRRRQRVPHGRKEARSGLVSDGRRLDVGTPK